MITHAFGRTAGLRLKEGRPAPWLAKPSSTWAWPSGPAPPKARTATPMRGSARKKNACAARRCWLLGCACPDGGVERGRVAGDRSRATGSAARIAPRRAACSPYTHVRRRDLPVGIARSLHQSSPCGTRGGADRSFKGPGGRHAVSALRRARAESRPGPPRGPVRLPPARCASLAA